MVYSIKKVFRTFSLFTILCLILCSIAPVTYAQVCGGGYARGQRSAVVSQDSLVSDVLTRMAELAEISSNATLSSAQRLAYNEEFNALKTAINDVHVYLGEEFTDRSRQFFNDVIDVNYLLLSDANLLGPDTDSAVSNARNALIKINEALVTARLCLRNSYDRVTISGVPNDRRCAGGFNEDDWRFPTQRFIPLRDTLRELAKIVSESVGPLSVLDRKLQQADVDFIRGEIMTFGVGFPKASNRTNNFITKVFNPVFLGLEFITVDGATSEEANENALLARRLVFEALSTSERCLFVPVRVRGTVRFVD